MQMFLFRACSQATRDKYCVSRFLSTNYAHPVFFVKMFKACFLCAVFFLFCSVATAGEKDFSPADLFPKSGELPGGSSAWIVSGVTEEKRDKCSLYVNTYTYYSDKGSVLLGIERSNTYMVSVRVFACGNFLAAMDEYDSLLAAEAKIEGPKKSASVAFGERGTLTAVPVKKDTMMADFYLTYLLRNFVVQVYSDDGFAQMDMAGEVERRLKAYFAGLGASYFINKINLEIKGNGLKDGAASVSFSGDNISTVVIDGVVYDGANRPVAGAEITALETGQKTVADEKGAYRLEVSAGQGRSVSLKKIIFLDGVRESGGEPLASGLYPLKIFKGSQKASEQVLSVLSTGGRLIGSLYNPDGSGGYPVLGEAAEDKVSFTLDCSSEGAAFKCSRSFTGSVSGGLVKGRWEGTGGGGSWEIDRAGFAVVKERPYLRDAGIYLTQAKISSGLVSGSASKLLTADNGKDRSFIRLVTGEEGKPGIYFKKGVLILNAVKNDSDEEVRVVLYGVSKGENGLIKLKKISEAASLNKGETGSVMVDISSQIRSPDKAGYLIGVESGGKASVVFSSEAAAELSYYRDTAGYKPTETVSGRIITFSGDDVTGNSGAIRPDGEGDIVAEASFSAPGRVLEYIEITAEGSSARRWNTNPFDIYPVVAVKSGGVLINNGDGSLSRELSGDTETFRLFFYRGSLKPEEIGKITVRAVIDGKVYENVMEK